MSRERELRNAIKNAGLPDRDYRIFRDLLDTADFRTAEIPGRFQPKSLEALARLCEKPVATLCRALNHLEAHGWVKRGRTVGGRGRSTAYTLAVGEPCHCPRPGRPRKPETLSQFPEPPGEAVAAAALETLSPMRAKPSHQREPNPLRINDKPAVQGPVSAGGHRGEGEGTRPGELGPCATCRVPTIRYGPRGRPLCDACSDRLAMTRAAGRKAPRARL